MALSYVIDTSAYSAFNRNQCNLERFINQKNEIFIPLIVIGELNAGFKAGNQPQVNQVLLSDFLSLPNLTILKLAEKTAEKYADIYIQLRQQGKLIGTNDMWIAATCLEHNLPLLTLDHNFKNIRGLELLI